MNKNPNPRLFGPHRPPSSTQGATLWDVGARTDIQVALGVVVASVLAGAINVKARTDLPWVADPPPPDATSCAAEAFGAPSESMRRISVQALAARLADPLNQPTLLVDARMGHAYLQGHIPTAESLPAQTAPALLQVQSLSIGPDIPVVTYCDGGECELSEHLAILLQDDVGCSEVMVLEGGFTAWRNEGLKIIAGDEPGQWPHPSPETTLYGASQGTPNQEPEATP